MSPTNHGRRTVLKGIGAGSALLIGGVGPGVADDDTDDQGDGTTAEVRVGHLSPDAPAVDVYVGKDPDGDPTVGGLSYPNFAPDADGGYVDVPAGSYDVAVTPAGTTNPEAVDVDGVALEANRDYTVLAVGELSPEGGEPGIRALPLVDNGDDDTALPPADGTLARFVHASPDAGEVDVAVDGATVLEGVEFADASSYLEAEPGDRTIQVLKDGTTVLEVPATLEPGTKITAYVIGNAAPEDGDESLSAVTTLDATSPARGKGKGKKKGKGRGRGDDEEEDDEEEREGEGDDGEEGEKDDEED